MSTRARLAGRGRKSATPSPSHHPVVVRAAAACSSASSRRRRGRAVAGVHGRPPTPARPQRRRRPQRACLRLRLRGVGRHVAAYGRSEEHTSELQSRGQLVCRLLLEKKKKDNFLNYILV